MKREDPKVYENIITKLNFFYLDALDVFVAARKGIAPSDEKVTNLKVKLGIALLLK
ncbi:hypothetical protein [Candidatus Protochlamydia amoebophila]|uniref:Uncharacterized protein n=1 Tax=Candidatus Protochlamydia amoebophila TaxID=362787 RepID=A0A0C1H6T0_9BACT|nr:hypothetical protein [Candidatus Protochlamydia amoebophila]KIC73164.1 hypothetical protein DB44_BL00040 [Candidatus Protochlamydia amoebophila]